MSQPTNAYVICSAPRSGTTLLCDMLTQTGVAGCPDSFFREKSLADWCDIWGVEGPIDRHDPDFTQRYFNEMWENGVGTTGMFGMRIMGLDLELANQWLARTYPAARSDLECFIAAFGRTRFIHLSRQDKVAEAVSYLRAEQTGLWHQRPDGSALEQIAPTAEDGYDPEAIAERLDMLSGFDVTWRDWFKGQGIFPLYLTYEALAEDPRGTLRQVLDYLGLDPELASHIEPGVRKLADQTNQTWIDRFRAERLGG